MKVTNHSKKTRSCLRIMTCVLAGAIAFLPPHGNLSEAVENGDYVALPPFTSTEVKPNVLFILDNSNSMDEDVDGAAVGSDSSLSRSEIARKAIQQIVRDNKNVMRFGLMTYEQENISKRYIHNSFYYASYGSSTYDSDADPSPKDPSENTKRYPNPVDPGNFIYYDTALPYYANNSQGYGFCYSKNFTEIEGDGNHNYRCYNTKTGDYVTPKNLGMTQLATYGYDDYFGYYSFVPTDSDIAAGFTQFGREMSWVPVGDTWFSNSSPGGGILHVDIDDSSSSHIADIESKLATSQFATVTDTPIRNAGLTPIAGTLDSAKDYFQGSGCTTTSGVTGSNPINQSCQKNYVILVTDGLPSVDSDGNSGNADELLAEVKASIESLRSISNSSYPSKTFDVRTYVVGFALPEGSGSKLDDLAVAGGTDVEGKALLADNAVELGQKLQAIFRDINKKVASGASSSVVSTSRSGEGTIYQSVFYPEYTDNHSPDKNTVTWVGNVHALFIDENGNLREDTNDNRQLDAKDDYIIVYGDKGEGTIVSRYEDVNGNNKLDPDEEENHHKGDLGLGEVNYVWDASSWLNEIADADILAQRSYGTAGDRRYIFTFDDNNFNKVVDTGEQIAFTTDQVEALADHLAIYPTRSDEPSWITEIRDDGNYDDFLENHTKRIINYIRGKDQDAYTSSTTPSYSLEKMRSRQADYDNDNTVETWRLGDVIHSSPLAVNRPFEGYHLLYDDESYAQFAARYAKRRTVIYVGGNDGMIHAFNGGFYDSDNKKVTLQSVSRAEPFIDEDEDGVYDADEQYNDLNHNNVYDDGLGGETEHALGSELWAYVPYNLLPHLRWLTLDDYQHVYYNDLTAHAFDAKIFTEETECGTTASDKLNDGCIHPNGWGTVLIAGMRLGGGLYPRSANFDFEDDSMGWEFSDDGTTQTFSDGLWQIETDSGIGSPYILSPANINIDGNLVKTISIRFATTANDAGAGGARLYWDTKGIVDKEKWNEGSVKIDAPAVDVSGDFYTYTFDLSAETDWSGTIKRIRIDPQGAFTAGSSVAIDYVDLGDGEGYVSSYTLLDITNPEQEPTVLAEVNVPGLGFTTAIPTIVPIKSKTDDSINDWYMVFGTGPNYNSLPYYDALPEVISNTKSKLYVLSLNELVKNKALWMLNDQGSLLAGAHAFAVLDENSIISDPITVDFDLDYDADAVYFGTIRGSDALGWQGKIRRILFNDGSDDTLTWTGDSTLLDLPDGQTVTAAGSVGIDNKDNFWVYFGTGRYYVRDDISNTATQSYYGIKEPTDADTGEMTWATVSSSELLDTTDALIYDDKTITGLESDGIETWYELITKIDFNKQGWKIDLNAETGERNIGQAALFGKILTFTSYVPSDDPCSLDGKSFGYGLYYKTGTAYYEPVIGYDDPVDPGDEPPIKKRTPPMTGLASPPAVHTPADGDGSKVIFQSSSGEIITVEEKNPGLTSSSKTGWRNLTD